jgi:hypothetical protein
MKREQQNRSYTYPPTYKSSYPGMRESAMLNGGRCNPGLLFESTSQGR